MQLQQCFLREKEVKIRKVLDRFCKKRYLFCWQWMRWEFFVIFVVGYINCGKIMLIKVLMGDVVIQLWDQLFVMLDVMVYVGMLFLCMIVLYVDIIGFFFQLLYGFIEFFFVILEDVVYLDFILYVRDVSYFEVEFQKCSVLFMLCGLQLFVLFLDFMVEVYNKVDFVFGYSFMELNVVFVFVLWGYGFQELKVEFDVVVLKVMGRQIFIFCVRFVGVQFSWLYKEVIVQEVDVIFEDGVVDVRVIISNLVYGKFWKFFLG